MPAAPQGGGGSDNSAGILWGVAAIFATIGFVWFAFKSQLVFGYLTVKLHETQFLSFLTDHLNYKAGYYDQLYQDISYARGAAGQVTFDQLMKLGNSVGDTLRWPLVLLCLILAIVVYVSSSTRVYRRTYSMKDLANLEKVNWPQISPVTGLDLIKTDIDVGPWAMAMNPMQFCKRNNLLQEVRNQRTEGMPRKDWDRVEVILKRGEASKIFAMQLGPAWRGTQYLPGYMRALFAAFAARINADTAGAAKLLLQLNLSCTSGKLDLSGVDELLRKHENSKLVKAKVEGHAYVLTVMATMLAGSREDGVQASADFLWLKPLDRRLWYTLNTVGRQTPFIEVAGVFAHWVAEKEASRKLIVPMIEEATNAVELALKEVVYKRDEVPESESK